MSTPITESGEVNLVVECSILAKDQILLQKRNGNSKIFVNYWTTPGGHIDDLENALEAVIREVKEETGLTLQEDQLTMREFAINKHTTRGKVYIVIGFVARLAEMLEPKNSDEGECKWVPLSELENYKIMEPVLRFIKLSLEDSNEVVHLADEYNLPELK